MKRSQGLNFSVVHCRRALKLLAQTSAAPDTQPAHSQAQPCSWLPSPLSALLCRDSSFILSASARFWPKYTSTL